MTTFDLFQAQLKDDVFVVTLNTHPDDAEFSLHDPRTSCSLALYLPMPA